MEPQVNQGGGLGRRVAGYSQDFKGEGGRGEYWAGQVLYSTVPILDKRAWGNWLRELGRTVPSLKIMSLSDPI